MVLYVYLLESIDTVQFDLHCKPVFSKVVTEVVAAAITENMIHYCLYHDVCAINILFQLEKKVMMECPPIALYVKLNSHLNASMSCFYPVTLGLVEL
jgi:hypothetical protein